MNQNFCTQADNVGVYSQMEITAMWPLMVAAAVFSFVALVSTVWAYARCKKLYDCWDNYRPVLLNKVMALLMFTVIVSLTHLVLMIDWPAHARWENTIPFELMMGYLVWHSFSGIGFIALHISIERLAKKCWEKNREVSNAIMGSNSGAL